MKPFNLMEAIDLKKPVVTRDGRAVILAGHNPRAKECLRIVGWIDDVSFAWSEDGRYDREEDSHLDLFMESTEKYVGFCTYLDSGGEIMTHTTCPYNTEDETRRALDRLLSVEFWKDMQNLQVIKIYI